MVVGGRLVEDGDDEKSRGKTEPEGQEGETREVPLKFKFENNHMKTRPGNLTNSASNSIRHLFH